MRSRFVSLAALSFVVACGSDAPAPSSEAHEGPALTSPSTAKPPGASPSEATSGDPLVGLWQVRGKDARGDYEGQAEVRPDGAGYKFIRTVRYPAVTVETDRELHWLFFGSLKKNGERVALDASLRQTDFITKRGKLERKTAEPPVALKGDFAIGKTELTGTFAGGNIALTDTWSDRKALPATPIFVDERTAVPQHDPPSATEKNTNFALYKSYHDLSVVKPYVQRAEFNAAIHRNIVDTTDFDFYRKNKNALRVVGKIVDDITLAETRVRADAYRWTLAEKAAKYQSEMHTRFVDPAVGTVPHGGPIGAKLSEMWESGDGSLWTAVYLASQAYRYQVTGEADALANVELTLDALLKLQEIVGDPSTFARTLRKARGPGGPWHAGTGAYAGLEWLEGGNNDMIKGLFYGYLLGWITFCEGGKTGHESLCQRIRASTKHLADDVVLGGSNAIASQQTNRLIATWLYAIFTEGSSDGLTYGVKAAGYWTGLKVGIAATPVYYSQGIVDWSGTHLTFVGDVIAMLAAERLNLGGDAKDVYRAHIDASHKNLERQRFPTWHLIKAAYGTGASTSSPWIKSAVSRLIETQWPKIGYESDRRIASDFCLSPYPAVPWKGDWTKYPNEDRTQALDLFPLFETGPSVNYWMTGLDYRGGEWEGHGGDYLHLYWFARKHGLLAATD